MHWLRSARQGRERVHSRPRVANAAAHAAQAAHQATRLPERMTAGLGTGLGLGNATAGAAVYILPEGATPTDADATRRATRGLPPALVGATVRAAHAAGRAPEDIWAEALGAWLAEQELEEAHGLRASIQNARRQRAWGEIEATLQALRAS